MYTDVEMMIKTRKRLGEAAKTSWPYESRLPGIDQLFVLKASTTPHLRRMASFLLTQRWRVSKETRMN